MPLLGLLEAVLVLGILFGIVYAVVRYAGMPEPWPTVAYGVLAIIAVVVIFGVIAGLPWPHVLLR